MEQYLSDNSDVDYFRHSILSYKTLNIVAASASAPKGAGNFNDEQISYWCGLFEDGGMELRY